MLTNEGSRCHPRLLWLVVLVLTALILGACGSAESGSSPDAPTLDPTPERIDGSLSYEFEQEDLDRAAEASPEVREYCEEAVSEAQELGCLSHVDESDVP